MHINIAVKLQFKEFTRYYSVKVQFKEFTRYYSVKVLTEAFIANGKFN